MDTAKLATSSDRQAGYLPKNYPLRWRKSSYQMPGKIGITANLREQCC